MTHVKSWTMMLATVVVSTVLIAGGGALAGKPGAEVAVVAASDTLETGRIDHLQVTVTNLQEVALQPLFSVQSDGYPFYWEATEEPITMQPGETRQVDLAPRSSRAMLWPGFAEPGGGQGRSRSFVVRVNDLDSSRYWVSEPTEVPLSLPPIAGPDFRAWSDDRDPRSGLRAPIGWDPDARRSGADQVDLRPGANGGVQLQVTRAPESPDDWTEAGLAQTIWRANCPTVELHVPEFPEYATVDGVGPALAAGLQIRDEAAPPGAPYAWVVLESRRTEPYRLANGTVIWPAHGDAGRYRVRLADLFTSAGQPEPARLNLKLFLAANRYASGTHQLQVDSFRCIAPPPLAALSRSGDGVMLPFGSAVMFSYPAGPRRSAPTERERVNQAGGAGSGRTKPETKPQVKPDSKPQAKPDSKPQAKPDSKPQAKPDSKPQTKSQTKQ